jgi:hypothetical protein
VLMMPKKGLKSLITHHPFPPSIPFHPSHPLPFPLLSHLFPLPLPFFVSPYLPFPNRLDSVCVCGGREGVAIPPPPSRFYIYLCKDDSALLSRFLHAHAASPLLPVNSLPFLSFLPLRLSAAKTGRNLLNKKKYPPPPHWDRRAI